MNINFREANLRDREFILNANREINILSGLHDSTLDYNIDKDVFENKVCKVIVVEDNNNTIGFALYSYIYWANCGRGIYLSQVYVKKEYRNQGIFKLLLQELELKEPECRFITTLVGNENQVMLNSMNKLGFESSDLITFYRVIKEKD